MSEKEQLKELRKKNHDLSMDLREIVSSEKCKVKFLVAKKITTDTI